MQCFTSPLVYHLTNLYFAKQTGFERFILLDGGIYTNLFWFGQILLGTLAPLAILFHPVWARSAAGLLQHATLVILGGFAQLYVLLIGGQAFPLSIFPGMQVSSSFFDGRINSYSPSTAGVPAWIRRHCHRGLADTVIAVRVLHFMPDDDSVKR